MKTEVKEESVTENGRNININGARKVNTDIRRIRDDTEQKKFKLQKNEKTKSKKLKSS